MTLARRLAIGDLLASLALIPMHRWRTLWPKPPSIPSSNCFADRYPQLVGGHRWQFLDTGWPSRASHHPGREADAVQQMHVPRSIGIPADLIAGLSAGLYIGALVHLSTTSWERASLDGFGGARVQVGAELTLYLLTMMTGLVIALLALAKADQERIAMLLSRPRILLAGAGVMAIAVLPEFAAWWHVHLSPSRPADLVPHLLAPIGATALAVAASPAIGRLGPVIGAPPKPAAHLVRAHDEGAET